MDCRPRALVVALLTVPLACTPDSSPVDTTAGGSETGDGSGTSSPTTSTDATATDGSTTDGSTTDVADGSTDDDGSSTGDPPPASPGCGLPAADPGGGVVVEIDAGPEGDGLRHFYLSLPDGYDPRVPHKLIVGYPGTNWVGEMIAPYLGLENEALPDEIFVYPDPLWRDFDGWGNLGGWVLGPHADPADGEQDLVFTEAVLQYMETNYCIDTDRIFATGHSWGGDMAQVVSCFMSDRFAATVPVAANSPYWFFDGNQAIDCPGDTAVWTMFGQNDTHFNSQAQGLECRDFWLADRGCDGVNAAAGLGLGDATDECVEFEGCSAPTRFCLYGAQYGHQIPDAYYAAVTMEFFRSF